MLQRRLFAWPLFSCTSRISYPYRTLCTNDRERCTNNNFSDENVLKCLIKTYNWTLFLSLQLLPEMQRILSVIITLRFVIVKSLNCKSIWHVTRNESSNVSLFKLSFGWKVILIDNAKRHVASFWPCLISRPAMHILKWLSCNSFVLL